MDQEQELNILNSTVCECGNDKNKRNAFCRKCYWALLPDIRRALWNKIGEGFEISYANAKKYLVCEIWKTN